MKVRAQPAAAVRASRRRRAGRGGSGRDEGVFNIPVVYANPTDAEAAAFLKITDDAANRPMFIHCTAAIRVGAFWAIRRLYAMASRRMLRSKKAGKSASSSAPRGFARKPIASHQPRK